MKLKNFLILTSTLALLGNGCINYSFKTTKVNDSGFDTAAMEAETNRDPYGKAEKAFNRVAETVKPSGTLDPTQPGYSMADRLSWYQKLNWPKECEADFRLTVDSDDDGIGVKGGLNFYKITDKQYLLHISCETGGNIGESMLFYLVGVDGQNISGKILHDQKYNPVTKSVEASAENDGVFGGNHYFDSANKILTIYTKAGHIGFCGSHTEYKIINDELEITKIKALSCEDLEAWILKHPNSKEAPKWPLIYEKKSAVAKPNLSLLDDSNWDLPEPNTYLNPKQEKYTTADRLGWYHTLGWSKTCEQEYRDFSQSEDGGLRFYEIESNKYLLSITCNVYAYQANLLFMLVTFDPQTRSVVGNVQTLQSYNPTSKKLKAIIGEDNKTPMVLGFDNFNSTEKTLSIFTKSRGLGDCGSRGTYKVIANKVTLIKYEAQSCEEADAYALANPDGDTGDWPILYFLP